MDQRCFCRWKIAKRNCRDAQEQQSVVVIRMIFQFSLELLAGLRIGFFSTKLEDFIAEESVSMRVFRIDLNGLAKFRDGGLREMTDGIRAADQHMERGRF